MMDKLVRELDPFVTGNDLHQVLLDLHGIGIPGEFEASRQAMDVGVHYHAVGNPEPGAEHDVCGLAGHAGQLQQFVHVARHFAAKIANQFLCRAHH